MKSKYNELTEEEKEYLILLYHDKMTHREKMDILSKKFKVSPRTIRDWWKNKLGLSQYDTHLPLQLKEVEDRAIPEKTDIILFTACQNKTFVNEKMLSNMKAYARWMEEKGYNPEIVVAPMRYRNPTSPTESREAKEKADEWWDNSVKPYLYFSKLQFGDTIISTRSRIIPTAKKPLTSFEVLAKDNNLVLPHTKIHFKTLPRLKRQPLRSLSTTGAISHKNYSDSKAGETGYLHHSYGFVVIELDNTTTENRTLIPRNVRVKEDGSFCDLDNQVSNGKVRKIKSSKGFIWGDIHDAVKDPMIFELTLNLCKKLKPKKHVLHDLFDGYTINPHEKKDMFIQKKKIRDGKYLLSKEISDSLDTIREVSNVGGDIYVTTSNHDIFLDRLINDGNWKHDLHNSETYLRLAYIQQTEDIEKHGSIFGYLLNKSYANFTKCKVKYVNFGESLNIGDYECALHGDNGANGARGNYSQFAKLNMKMIIGHQHSPAIENSVTVVGVTAKLNQYYTRKGLSSWAHAHAIVHPNNKNQLLVFSDTGLVSNLI